MFIKIFQLLLSSWTVPLNWIIWFKIFIETEFFIRIFLRNCTWIKWQNIVTTRAKCAGPKLLQVANLCICNSWSRVIENIALAVFNTLIPSRCNIKKHCTLPIECICRFSILIRKIVLFLLYSINRLSCLTEIPGALCAAGTKFYTCWLILVFTR